MRLTYPIQEAADPKDHFPLEHQTAEGETEIETKQIQLGHPALLLSSLCLSFLRHPPYEDVDVGGMHPRKTRGKKKIKKYKMTVRKNMKIKLTQ